MPELPEVETTARALLPYAQSQRIKQVRIHNRSLRAPIIPQMEQLLTGAVITNIRRRGKYLLFDLGTTGPQPSLLVHLGMSGSLRLSSGDEDRRKHDHIELDIGAYWLRYHDPRRFGLFEYMPAGTSSKWLDKLGVEPLQRGFNAKYLARLCAGRKRPIKNTIMDASLVVGVGNIYACEALFAAGINPSRPAGDLTPRDCQALVRTIKAVLRSSIRSGGTTLRDFVSGASQPGYFTQALKTYGRADQACYRCGASIECVRLANRSTFFCPSCQS